MAYQLCYYMLVSIIVNHLTETNTCSHENYLKTLFTNFQSGQSFTKLDILKTQLLKFYVY